MILGISSTLFTQIHVVISLIAIASGIIVALGFLSGRLWPALTTVFLVTTILTSAQSFFFPFHGITPGIILGILSLIVLLFTCIAYYAKHLAGGWRTTFVVTSMIALYFNIFVLIAQSFQKIPALHALAPTGTELPFKLAQATLLIVFVVLTTMAVKRFRTLIF